jgi:hypothetical protein
MRSNRRLRAFAPCLVLIGAMSASADTIQVSSFNPGLSNAFYLSTTATGGLPAYVVGDGNVNFAGVFNTTDNSGPSFVSYCVDLYHDQNYGPPPFSATQSSSLSGDRTNPILVSSNPNVTTSQELAYLFNTNGLAVATSYVGAAALQVALWVVEYDGPNVTYNNGSGGVFSIGGSSDVVQIQGNSTYGNEAIAQAIGFIQDLQNQVNNNPTLVALQAATFFVVDNHDTTGYDFQDLITGSGSGFSPGVVPEPSSIALMVVGLGAVAFRVRKARQTRGNA